MRTGTRVVVLAAAALLSGAIALPAGATTPLRSGSFSIDLSGSDPCDGFAILSSGELTVRVTTFLDRAGNPTTLHIHASRGQTLTNSVTGKTLELRGSVLVIVDLTTGWETWLGQVIMSNDRGVGNVIQDTGRIVFDADFNVAFLAGPHDAITNPGVVCSRLA